jgi:hypothetical protein
MKEALTYIVKSLIEDSENLEFSYSDENNAIRFKISVPQSERGRIIGKEGRIIKSIRSYFQAVASKDGKKVFVDIV